jgi:hypothetical protein
MTDYTAGMRRLHATAVLASSLGALLIASLALPGVARAEGFSIGARAGTTGIGPELAFGLGPRLDVRIPVGVYSYDDVYDKTGIRYDAKLELRNALLLADFHPFLSRSGSAGGFRLSAGGGWDDNRLKVSAPVRELVRRYRPELAPLIPSNAGTIHGEATGSSFAPYLGLGWGSATRGGRWGVSFDAGVIYQGSPHVDLKRAHRPRRRHRRRRATPRARARGLQVLPGHRAGNRVPPITGRPPHLMRDVIASRIMRTTLDISDPVLADVRKVQEREGGSLGEVVSQLLTEGLAAHRGKVKRRRFEWTARNLGARIDVRDKDALWAMLDRETRAER